MKNNKKLISSNNHYGFKINSPIQNPTCAVYLPDNTVAIGGFNGLAFFDLKTQKTLSFIEITKIVDIATNDDRTRLTISNMTGIREYNTKTQDMIRRTSTICPGAFLTYANNNQLIIYNATQKGSFITSTPANQDTHNVDLINPINGIAQPISYNSQNNSFLVAKDQSNFVLYTAEEPFTLKSTIDFPLQTTIIGAECSKNDDYFIFNDKNEGILIHHKELTDGYTSRCASYGYYLRNHNKNHSYSGKIHCPSMALNSNNILAVLLRKNTLQYWDCHTQKKIATTKLKPCQALDDQEKLTKRLSFSLDDAYIVVALKKNCFILPTPFKTRALSYQKYFFINMIWSLIPTLPTDIILLIMNNILKI